MGGRLSRIEKWETLARRADFHPANMAALCSMSLRQLERFFARRFRQTPGQWSRELKCRQALKLITEGYSNKAVVAELKFASESHFCHEFKRVYGASPQSFLPGSQKCRF
jgi:AraC-like DNA-binding protein